MPFQLEYVLFLFLQVSGSCHIAELKENPSFLVVAGNLLLSCIQSFHVLNPFSQNSLLVALSLFPYAYFLSVMYFAVAWSLSRVQLFCDHLKKLDIIMFRHDEI